MCTDLRTVVVQKVSREIMAGRVVAAVAILIVALSSVTAEEQCVTTRTMLLSVRHAINATGQPQLSAHLEHDMDGLSWQLDIELGKSCSSEGNPNNIMDVKLNGISYRPKIPPTYKMIPGFGYFRQEVEALSWLEARDACAAEGAVLVTPSSDREAIIIANDVFTQNGTDDEHEIYVWLGLNDFVEEGKFVSLDGVPIEETSLSKWDPGQPDGGEAESCTILEKNSAIIYDAPCAWKLSYICKLIV